MACGQMTFRTFTPLLTQHVIIESWLLYPKLWEYNDEKTDTILAFMEFIVSSRGSQTLLHLLIPRSHPKLFKSGCLEEDPGTSTFQSSWGFHGAAKFGNPLGFLAVLPRFAQSMSTKALPVGPSNSSCSAF